MSHLTKLKILTFFKSVLMCAFVGVLAACASQQPYSDLNRICDSAGCSDRSVGVYQQDSTATITDEAYRAAALIELAENDSRAAYDLGLRYFRGDGVRQDSYQAIQWMRRAGEAGNLEAQKALGRIYLTGVEEMGADFREAEKWLSIAASQGDRESAELWKEATRLKQTEAQYSPWSSRWRSIIQRNWRQGYPYQSYWRHNRWNHY